MFMSFKLTWGLLGKPNLHLSCYYWPVCWYLLHPLDAISGETHKPFALVSAIWQLPRTADTPLVMMKMMKTMMKNAKLPKTLSANHLVLGLILVIFCLLRSLSVQKQGGIHKLWLYSK